MQRRLAADMDGSRIWTVSGFTWMKTRRMVRSAIRKKLSSGLHGRVKPVMVSPGDVFVFGGGEDAVVSPATVWAFFRTRYYDAPWRAMDSRGCSKFLIVDGDTRTKLANPEPGSVVECEHGMVIYMGALTYVIGPLKVMGSKGSTDGTNYYRTN